MADIFVSYTSRDKEWAFWIGQELEKLGHTPRIHEWEISGGGDIAAWMEERHQKADHILCVISRIYLTKPYSSWERRSAQWAAQTERPNFALPVRIEDCELPTLLASVKYCDLFGAEEKEARARLKDFLEPAAKPTGSMPFPGAKKVIASSDVQPPRASITFPGQTAGSAISNIPINVPRYFLGREAALTAIDAELRSNSGRVAITALHGLRGVGKTVLAAAYAERRAGDYRATWWIRAETESTMRADLVGLGVRLGWVAADEKEESALTAVIERLRHEDERILLIYDNANNADELRPYMPRGGLAQVIVTSTAPDWGSMAAPVQIQVWPGEVGADYLIARTQRGSERHAALVLSDALGGLPLAHEQVAAYCERLGFSFSDYLKRFEAAPAKLLDADKDAPPEYHDRTTVTKTFALAINEAKKLHPVAEFLIAYAALLAPEPIPLFLFYEARKQLGEPLASLAIDGLDEAVAALRAFALVGREAISDERDPSITTDCIRLHRLVRQVAAARISGVAQNNGRSRLILAIATVYPGIELNDPAVWPRARRLDPLALDLLAHGDETSIQKTWKAASYLLDRLASYRHTVLTAYSDAKPLFERALTIRENSLGEDHPDTASSHNNLGGLLQEQGDLAGARTHYEKALAIFEKVCGADSPETAACLSNLGALSWEQGDPAEARRQVERSLEIRERVLGPDHVDTANSLNNLGYLLLHQGDLEKSQQLFELALAIREKALGSSHPETNVSRGNLARALLVSADLTRARPLAETALEGHEMALGADHPWTQESAELAAKILQALGQIDEARILSKKYRITDQEKS